jgi:hypothetical protein
LEIGSHDILWFVCDQLLAELLLIFPPVVPRFSMKNTLYVCLIALSALLLTACGDDNNLTGPPSTADLLTRKWLFTNVSVITNPSSVTTSPSSATTNSRTYAIPAQTTGGLVVGNSSPITFLKDGTYTTIDSGKVVTDKWTLTDKKLTLIDTKNPKNSNSLTIVSISATDMVLGSTVVDVTKDRKPGDTKFYGPTDIVAAFFSFGFGGTPATTYTQDEATIALLSAFFLTALEKDNGGTIDFKKEPAIKTIQFVINAKAQ